MVTSQYILQCVIILDFSTVVFYKFIKPSMSRILSNIFTANIFSQFVAFFKKN